MRISNHIDQVIQCVTFLFPLRWRSRIHFWKGHVFTMATKKAPAELPGQWRIHHFGWLPRRKLTWLAGKSTIWRCIVPIEHGDVPASHVSFRGCRNPHRFKPSNIAISPKHRSANPSPKAWFSCLETPGKMCFFPREKPEHHQKGPKKCRVNFLNLETCLIFWGGPKSIPKF